MLVVALSVHVEQTIGPEYELWVAFGSGKHFWYLADRTKTNEG